MHAITMLRLQMKRNALRKGRLGIDRNFRRNPEVIIVQPQKGSRSLVVKEPPQDLIGRGLGVSRRQAERPLEFANFDGLNSEPLYQAA